MICRAMFTYPYIASHTNKRTIANGFSNSRHFFHNNILSHVYYAILIQSYFYSDLHLCTNKRIITNVFSTQFGPWSMVSIQTKFILLGICQSDLCFWRHDKLIYLYYVHIQLFAISKFKIYGNMTPIH